MQKNVVLAIDKIQTLEIVLEVGAQTQTVTVTEAPPLVNTSTAEIGRTVSPTEIINLPLVNRNAYSELSMTPGVMANSASHRRQRQPRIQLGRHDADHVAPLIHQRPARIARLHRRADLKIPRVIPRSKFDFPMAISPVVAVRQHLGANPCKPMSEKPTVATVPPNCADRLDEMGNGENFPSALSKARSFAASTLTTLASIKPALVSKRTFAASLTT